MYYKYVNFIHFVLCSKWFYLRQFKELSCRNCRWPKKKKKKLYFEEEHIFFFVNPINYDTKNGMDSTAIVHEWKLTRAVFYKIRPTRSIILLQYTQVTYSISFCFEIYSSLDKQASTCGSWLADRLLSYAISLFCALYLKHQTACMCIKGDTRITWLVKSSFFPGLPMLQEV